MSDLFEVPETPSPRLAWLKKHRLTIDSTELHTRCRNAGYTQVGYGEDADEAILDYCARHNLKHWTLE